MMGPQTQSDWTRGEAIAWEGLLEVSRRLRRDAEDLLGREFDLSISMLGITGRLAIAARQTLKQTELAQAMGLSLSRVSRVIDLLEQRGLAQRRSCPSDARATNVTLTRRGGALTASAQTQLLAFVQAAFIDALGPAELATLATAFTRMLNAPGEPPGRDGPVVQ
jgi:DNA-binding MarR family transcriptional regulator